MQYTTFLAFGLAVSSSAQKALVKRQDASDDSSSAANNVSLPCDPDSDDCMSAVLDYLDDMCLPYNSTTGIPDLNAPCNQVQAINNECLQGAVGFDEIFASMNPGAVSDADSDDSLWLDPVTQRDCYCQSQYFVANEGCAECFIKHGGAEVQNYGNNEAFATKSMSIFSTSYCAATNTPAYGFQDALNNFEATLLAYFATSSVHSTFSDPLGSKTAVSLYYSPSVTGSAAWVVGEATDNAARPISTATSSDSLVTGTGTGYLSVANSTGWRYVTPSVSGSVHISNGQIVATASANVGSAQETAAIAGVVALVGFVALL